MKYHIVHGNVTTILPTLPEKSVQCVVTSPPYFGLRQYLPDAVQLRPDISDEERVKVMEELKSERVFTMIFDKQHIPNHLQRYCIPAEIGLEPTPQEFVNRMVEVFREVRRVLKDDGVLFLNLGDSYYGAVQRGSQFGSKATQPQWKDKPNAERGHPRGTPHPNTGLKFKDLIGIPWRVAFALQADGWYLRQDIIWHKPNPMPESVKDRCTKAHEYVFLLSKSPKYLYNADAIAEPIAESSKKRYQHAVDTNEQFDEEKHKHTDGVQTPMKLLTRAAKGVIERGIRNRRSVWRIATQNFEGAHFATFPLELPTLCIKAGSNPGDTVLDPFNGAATTGVAAQNTGRNYIGIELNPEYVKLSQDRLAEHASAMDASLF